jgi:hypothetical protein
VIAPQACVGGAIFVLGVPLSSCGGLGGTVPGDLAALINALDNLLMILNTLNLGV